LGASQLLRQLLEREGNPGRHEQPTIRELRDDEIERAFRYAVTFPSFTSEWAQDRIAAFMATLNGACAVHILLPWCESSDVNGKLLRDYVVRRQAAT
jgi:hypothetical protein